MIEEIKEMNEIYYKIYKKDNKLSVVCMQWFDEFDYKQENFIKLNNGDELKFSNKDDANKVLKILDKDNNQPDYKSAWEELTVTLSNYFELCFADTNVQSYMQELEQKYKLGGE